MTIDYDAIMILIDHEWELAIERYFFTENSSSQDMTAISVLFAKKKGIVNKTMSQLRNGFDGDTQIETLSLIERTMKAAIKLEKAHRAWDCWSLCI